MDRLKLISYYLIIGSLIISVSFLLLDINLLDNNLLWDILKTMSPDPSGEQLDTKNIPTNRGVKAFYLFSITVITCLIFGNVGGNVILFILLQSIFGKKNAKPEIPEIPEIPEA